MPQFHNVSDKSPRDDRFDPPKLEPEDYQRLERSREALTRRRKVHLSDQFCVCVDNVERAWFKPRRTTRVQLDINPGESLIEVRGEDAQGALPVAMLIVCCDDIPSGEAFRDSILLDAGQRVTIQLKPIRNVSGDLERATVEVSYSETKLMRAVIWYLQRASLRLAELTKHHKGSDVVMLDYSWLAKTGFVLALIVAITLIWFQFRPSNNKAPSAVSDGGPGVPTVQPGVSAPPAISPALPVQKQNAQLIAKATWSRDQEAARQAIRLETERGEVPKVEILRRQRRLLIALPQVAAEGEIYTYYRATLLAAYKPIWQQTLRAPRVRPSPYAHALNVWLSPQSQIKTEAFVLRFDGKTRSGWQPLGQVTLQLVDR